jgi:hypothetical protein
VALFLPLVCGTGALVSALGVRHTEAVISSASTQTLRALVGELRAQIGRAIDPATALLELRRMQELAEDRTLSQRLALLPDFADALAKAPPSRPTRWRVARVTCSWWRGPWVPGARCSLAFPPVRRWWCWPSNRASG